MVIINNGFFYNVKQTVYKWWCVIYRPVYKLMHHGYWPAEKEPYYIPPETNATVNSTAAETTVSNESPVPESIQENSQFATQKSLQSNLQATVQNPSQGDLQATVQKASQDDLQSPDSDSTGSSDDSARRAQEIMDRLAREAAEDEAKKQAEIDAAKRKAEEEARLASIMNANKVDISQFINQGMANRSASNETSSTNTVTESTNNNQSNDEAMRRAQDIIDRLNREAAEDEAKKQAEIDAAKEYARQNNL